MSIQDDKKKKLGLALSGGGYRATAYHLGTFRKLNQLKILDKIDVISSISGGSITNGLYGLYGEDFKEFEEKLIKGVKSNVTGGIIKSLNFVLIVFVLLMMMGLAIWLLFTTKAWLSSILIILTLFFLFKYQFKLLPISKIIESLYDRFFFKRKNLSDLRKKPVMAINGTNLETARQFTFSQDYMGDSSYVYKQFSGKKIEFDQASFPIARAVAASTCVPFAFTPISIAKKYFKNPVDYDLVNPKLVDGGVYDNQGIHKLTQKNSKFGCETIIVSDAGAGGKDKSVYNNTIKLLIRTSDIFMKRIKNVQMMKDVYQNYQFEKREIAYQSLGWSVKKCIPGFIDNLKEGLILDSLLKYHGITKKEVKDKQWEEIENKLKKSVDYEKILLESPTDKELKIARAVSTNLKTLSDEQINSLIKQASSMTEIQVKLYCPSLCKKKH